MLRRASRQRQRQRTCSRYCDRPIEKRPTHFSIVFTVSTFLRLLSRMLFAEKREKIAFRHSLLT